MPSWAWRVCCCRSDRIRTSGTGRSTSPARHRLVELLPLADVLRVPARFGMLVVLAVAVLASLGAARLLARRSFKGQAAAFALLGFGVMWEATPAPVPLRPMTLFARPGERVAYGWLAEQPPGAVLQLPSYYGLDPQFGALVHGHPVVNGVSRLQSPVIELINGSAFPLARPDTASEAIAPLRALGVRYVLIAPEEYEDRDLGRAIIDALAASDQIARKVTFGVFTAFELKPWPAAAQAAADALRQVPATAMRVTASDQQARVDLMIDGDPASRWLTNRPQAGNEWVDVVFDEPRAIVRMDLVATARSTGDYPRHVVVTVSSGGGDTVAWQGDPLVLLAAGFRRAPALPVMRIPLSGAPIRHLRIRQTGSSDKWYWSIDELRLWERQPGR